MSAPVIGQYCGHVSAEAGPMVVSSGRDLMVLFRTDRHTDRRTDNSSSRPTTRVQGAGFHAVFSFVRLQNDSSSGSTDDDPTSRYVDVAQQSPDVHWSTDYALDEDLGIRGFYLSTWWAQLAPSE